MVTLFRRWRLQFVFAGVLLPVFPAYADDPEAVIRLRQNDPAGVVRLNSGTGTVIRGQSPASTEAVDMTESGLELANCELTAVDANVGAVAGQGMGAHGDVAGLGEAGSVYSDGSGGQVIYCPEESVGAQQGPLARKLAAIRGRHAAAGIHSHGGRGYDDGHSGRGHFGLGGLHGHNHHHGSGRIHGNGHKHGEVPLAGKYHIVYPVDPSYFDARDGQVYAAQGYGGPVSVPLAPVVNHTFNYGWGIPSSRLTPVLHPVTQAPLSTMPGVYTSAPISY